MGDISNRDEAERCRDMAIGFLKQRQFEKAARFFDKSMRLYPLPGVQDLADKAHKLASQPPPSSGESSHSSSQSHSNSNSHSNRSSHDESSSSSGSSARPAASRSAASPGATHNGERGAYTDEQEQGAKRILELAKRSHYEVLGVGRRASKLEIMKGYKKAALKFHPDKNKAPSAEPAFKAINLAKETLTDASKRETYDQVGHESAERINQQGGDAGNPFAGGGFRGGGMHFNGAEVSPEDLFNMFFQGGMGGGGGARVFHTNFGGGGGMPFRRRGGGGMPQAQRDPRQEREEADGPLGLIQRLFQFLPMIMMLLMAFGSFGGTGTGSTGAYADRSAYSLSQKGSFVLPRYTSARGVVPNIPYFVSDKFAVKTSKYDLGRIEKQVENDYRDRLSSKCHNEREAKNTKVYQARKTRNKEAIEEAKSLALPTCDEMTKMFPNFNQNAYRI